VSYRVYRCTTRLKGAGLNDIRVTTHLEETGRRSFPDQLVSTVVMEGGGGTPLERGCSISSVYKCASKMHNFTHGGC
jgi:hypothetical protein